VHQHETHTQAGEQIEVMRQRHEFAVGDDFATESHDERTPTESVDVRSRGAEPVDELFGR